MAVSEQLAVSGHVQAWRSFMQQAAPQLESFERSIEDPARAQEACFFEAIECGVGTAFGKAHGFDGIRAIEDYRQRVPISRWADCAPWIERAQRVREPVLTREPPLHFERTSGSTAQTKHIPYTPRLLAQLQRALVVWLAKLGAQCPQVFGPAWWSLSPDVSAPETAPNGVPVGSADDSIYLRGSVAEVLLSTVIDTNACLHSTNWKTRMLACAAACEDLALISVWSPTWLSAVLDVVSDPDTRERELRRMRELLQSDRYEALCAALDASDFSILWPQLRVLSAWADGPSASYAAHTASVFSGVALVPKGLFATEGIVTLPWGIGAARPVAVTSHFYEFLDTQGVPRLLDELVAGDRYEPVLTTGGGLYRYATGDLVEVTGLLGRTPTLKFVGRVDARVDLVGEKLDEGLVSAALALAGFGDSAVVLACRDARPPHYVVLAELPGRSDPGLLERRLEAALCECYHYGLARRNGQLAAIRVRRVDRLAPVLHTAWESLGRRSGDAKAATLVTSQSLTQTLLGQIDFAEGGV